MKILILGHARHGKDTVAEMLHQHFDLKFASSSREALAVIYPVLDTVNGLKSLDEHFAERHENRILWQRLIALYNAADPQALTKRILSRNDVYVGMRSLREFRANFELFDLILYVDASKRIPSNDPSMEIPFDGKLMTKVVNNGNLDELRRRLIGNLQDIIKGNGDAEDKD